MSVHIYIKCKLAIDPDGRIDPEFKPSDVKKFSCLVDCKFWQDEGIDVPKIGVEIVAECPYFNLEIDLEILDFCRCGWMMLTPLTFPWIGEVLVVRNSFQCWNHSCTPWWLLFADSRCCCPTKLSWLSLVRNGWLDMVLFQPFPSSFAAYFRACCGQHYKRRTRLRKLLGWNSPSSHLLAFRITRKYLD